VEPGINRISFHRKLVLIGTRKVAMIGNVKWEVIGNRIQQEEITSFVSKHSDKLQSCEKPVMK